MSCIKKMMDFSIDRVRSFTVFEMGLFKLTMFFLGILFAANMPRFSRRGRGLLAVVTTILTGTFLGYFFFGERYFELDTGDGTAVAEKRD